MKYVLKLSTNTESILNKETVDPQTVELLENYLNYAGEENC